MNEATKKMIDEMDYEVMLRRWRTSQIGDPMFQDETGKYFVETMRKKGDAIGFDARVAASKRIGWE